MRRIHVCVRVLVFGVIGFLLSSCAHYNTVSVKSSDPTPVAHNSPPVVQPLPNYASRLPSSMDTHGQKLVLVDPNVHAWGAYGPDGNLIRAGLATAGNDWCPDIKRGCRTKAGTFRVTSLGSANCKSTIYPLPHGGAPMPYCMYFNGKQGLHGSYNVVEGNVSHGCVRMRVSDAEWLRFNFVNVGTKVIVRPY